MSVFNSFLWLNTVSLYGYTVFFKKSIHLLMDIWFLPTLGLCTIWYSHQQYMKLLSIITSMQYCHSLIFGYSEGLVVAFQCSFKILVCNSHLLKRLHAFLYSKWPFKYFFLWIICSNLLQILFLLNHLTFSPP